MTKGWSGNNGKMCTQALLVVLLGSVAALAAAYIAEYTFGLKPCPLCLYQRIPYAVVVVLSGLGLAVYGQVWKMRLVLVLSLLALLAGAGLAGYHTGIEQGVFKGLDGCGSELPAEGTTLEALREQLMAATEAARCDKPAFVFFGLSMAGWNVLYSLGLFLLGILAWGRKGGRT